MMEPRYYCYECRTSLDNFPSVRTDTISGSTYQAAKFIEHTLEGSGSTHDINSVFKDASRYKDWVISSAGSGCLEIDGRGRHNYVYYAGRTIGATCRKGQLSFENDVVKLVKPYHSDKIHAFSDSSTGYHEACCESCGKPVIT